MLLFLSEVENYFILLNPYSVYLNMTLFRWSASCLSFISFSVNTIQTALVISFLCTDKIIVSLLLKPSIVTL